MLQPHTLQCGMADAAAQKTRVQQETEYLGEIDFVSSNQDVASILSGFSRINDKFGNSNAVSITSSAPENSGSYHQHNFGLGKPCDLPKKDEDTILYK